MPETPDFVRLDKAIEDALALFPDSVKDREALPDPRLQSLYRRLLTLRVDALDLGRRLRIEAMRRRDTTDLGKRGLKA